MKNTYTGKTKAKIEACITSIPKHILLTWLKTPLMYVPFLLELRPAVGAFNDGEGPAALLAQLLALTQLLERDPAKALGAG